MWTVSFHLRIAKNTVIIRHSRLRLIRLQSQTAFQKKMLKSVLIPGSLLPQPSGPTAFFSCASHVVAPDSPWGEIKRILKFGEEFRILRHGLISDPIFAESSPTITYLQMLVLIIYLVWMNEIWYSSQSHLEFSIFFPSVTLLVLARLLFLLALSSPASW